MGWRLVASPVGFGLAVRLELLEQAVHWGCQGQGVHLDLLGHLPRLERSGLVVLLALLGQSGR